MAQIATICDRTLRQRGIENAEGAVELTRECNNLPRCARHV